MSEQPKKFRRLRKWGWTLFVVFAVLAGGYYGLTRYLSPEKVRTLASEAVLDATGRELRITGPIKLHLFTLNPTIEMNEVTFANASWGSRPEMVTVDKVFARLQLFPLLTKQIVVSELQVVRPDISLEVNSKGAQNWDVTLEKQVEQEPVDIAIEETAPASGGGFVPVFKSLFIEEGQLGYRNQVTGEKTQIALDKLKVAAASSDAPISLELIARHQQQTLEVEGRFGSFDVLAQQEGPFPIDATFALKPGLAAEVDGVLTLRAEGQLPLYEGALSLEAQPSAAPILAGFVDLPALPTLLPLSLKTEVAVQDSSLLIESLRLSNKNKGLSLAANGAVTTQATKNKAVGDIDLSLNLDVKQAALLNDLFDSGLNPDIPVAVKGRVQTQKGQVIVNATTVTAGNSDVALDGTVGKNTALTIQSNRLDFGQLLADPVEPTLDAATKEPSPKAQTAPSGPLLPADIFNSYQGTVSLAAAELILPDFPKPEAVLQDLQAKIIVSGSKITVAPFSVIAPGQAHLMGAVSGHRRSDTVADWHFDLEGHHFDLAKLLDIYADSDFMKRGLAGFDIDVKARGQYWPAIQQTLTGDINLFAGQSLMKSQYAQLIGSDLAKRFLPWREGQENTVVNCFVARLPVKSGVAETEPLFIDLPEAILQARGTIDFGRDRFNLAITPQPKDPSLLSLPAPLTLKGRLLDPEIGLDLGSIAKDTLTAVAVGALNPAAGLLTPFVSGGMADKDLCGRYITVSEQGIPSLKDGPSLPAGVIQQPEESKTGPEAAPEEVTEPTPAEATPEGEISESSEAQPAAESAPEASAPAQESEPQAVPATEPTDSSEEPVAPETSVETEQAPSDATPETQQAQPDLETQLKQRLQDKLTEEAPELVAPTENLLQNIVPQGN